MTKAKVDFLTVIAHGQITVGRWVFPADLYHDGTAARMTIEGDWVACDPSRVMVEGKRPILIEAQCDRCGETFLPFDVEDLEHLTCLDGADCGGKGEIVRTRSQT